MRFFLEKSNRDLQRAIVMLVKRPGLKRMAYCPGRFAIYRRSSSLAKLVYFYHDKIIHTYLICFIVLKLFDFFFAVCFRSQGIMIDG